MRGIISFNVIGEKLYTLSPAILYYHGDSEVESVKKVFSEDKSLISWLIDNAISLTNYSALSIYYTTYFTEDDNADTEETVKQDHFIVSDIISFEDVCNMMTRLALKKAFNTDINEKPSLSVKRLISTGLSMPTIVNGVRKALQDANINKEDVAKVMKELQEQ